MTVAPERTEEKIAAPPAAFGESRLWPALALLTFIGLNIGVRVWLPASATIRVVWLAPTLEVLLLLVLLASDPVTLRRHRSWLRPVALSLVGLLVLAALYSTVLLVSDLIRGVGVSNDAGQLLASGGLVWLGNNLAFALLYWLIDSGGPITRSHDPTPVDFAFTQQMSPEIAPPGWHPVFLDYLHLGFTNATAFSPTDVMPLTHRAKYLMLVQSTLALALFGLIVARAVNAF